MADSHTCFHVLSTTVVFVEDYEENLAIPRYILQKGKKYAQESRFNKVDIFLLPPRRHF